MGTRLSSCGFGFSHPALNSPWHHRLKPNYDSDCKMWHLASCHTPLYFCFAQVCVSVWAAVRTCLDLLFPVAAAITSSYREFLSFLPLPESVDWTCCWNGCQVGVLRLLLICGFLQWCHLSSQNHRVFKILWYDSHSKQKGELPVELSAAWCFTWQKLWATTGTMSVESSAVRAPLTLRWSLTAHWDHLINTWWSHKTAHMFAFPVPLNVTFLAPPVLLLSLTHFCWSSLYN